MTTIRLGWTAAALVLALALGGCNPESGDSGTTCTSYDCAIIECASHGAQGGRCIGGRCYCDGVATGACDDLTCANACRNYEGAAGGTCTGTTTCTCTGMPDAGTDTGRDIPSGGSGSAHGVVMSPGNVFPISGALVYAQPVSSPVAPLPEGNYCPRCLDMTLLSHTFSGADGYFHLEHLSVGDHWLVVQKGQFRRVRQITISTDGEELSVPGDFTMLPDFPNPAGGDTIPRIAVALGSYDDMEDILAKVALADVGPDNHAVLGTAVFDFFDNGGGWGERPFSDVITDPALMAQYQIIFVPCSDSTNDSYLTNGAVRDNIRNWVANGGKWYVADWSYEWVEFMFPEAMDMQGNDDVVGDADQSPPYDGHGRVVDPEMAAWLRAMGADPDNMVFDEIWDNICGLGTIAATDEDGVPVDVTPKIWAEGPHEAHPCGGGTYPYTISFPFGCGRVLFTTYHTVGAMGETHAGLLDQEKILLYLVMEIGVCTDEVIIW